MIHRVAVIPLAFQQKKCKLFYISALLLQTAISTFVFTKDYYFLDTGVFQSNRDVVPEISLLFGNWRNPIERTIFFSLGNCFLVYY
jgi:hypothetical protein